MRRHIIAIILLATAGTVKANGLDIFVNDKAFSIDYLTAYRGSDLNFGFLTNTSNDWAANAGLLVLGREYGSGSKFEGGLGTKLYVTSISGTSITALAIGGQGIYFPQGSKFGVGGFLYYAPDIITFGGTSLAQYGVRVEYKMVETASIYLGLNNLSVTPDAGTSVAIDEGLHVGVNLRF